MRFTQHVAEVNDPDRWLPFGVEPGDMTVDSCHDDPGEPFLFLVRQFDVSLERPVGNDAGNSSETDREATPADDDVGRVRHPSIIASQSPTMLGPLCLYNLSRHPPRLWRGLSG